MKWSEVKLTRYLCLPKWSTRSVSSNLYFQMVLSLKSDFYCPTPLHSENYFLGLWAPYPLRISNSLRGGGMDIFWNRTLHLHIKLMYSVLLIFYVACYFIHRIPHWCCTETECWDTKFCHPWSGPFFYIYNKVDNCRSLLIINQ